jgi:hypothetical protein
MFGVFACEPRVRQPVLDGGDQDLKLDLGRAVAGHDCQYDRISKNVTE